MLNSTGKLPVGEAVSSAYKFLPHALPKLLPATVFYFAFTFLSTFTQDPNSFASGPMTFLITLLYIAVGIAYSVALFRLAIRDEISGIYGLKFSADEGRYLGASILIALIITPIAIIGSLLAFWPILFNLDFNGVDLHNMTDQDILNILSGIPSWAGLYALIGSIALIVLLFWFSMRLICVLPAIIGKQKILIRQAFTWTKGNAWEIFGAFIVVVIPYLSLTFSIRAIMGPNPIIDKSVELPYAILYSLLVTAYTIVYAGLYSFMYKGFVPSDRLKSDNPDATGEAGE